MAKTLSPEEKLDRQLEADIKKLEKEGQGLKEDSDRFEEKLDKLQDKIEDLKDQDKISSEQEHQLKGLLDEVGRTTKEKEAGTPNTQLNSQVRDIDREIRALESTVKKDGEKSDPVEDLLDDVEEKINELKKAGSDDKEIWKKIKRLEAKLDTIK